MPENVPGSLKCSPECIMMFISGAIVECSLRQHIVNFEQQVFISITVLYQHKLILIYL